jgi:gamma-glutamylcyclotransferase (GGCT)/AIG2-like uncharacterized protein YtfP
MRYFAYGSNLHHGQLAARCPSARFVGPARLAEHRLAFTRFSQRRQCGVLDIVACAAEHVWGGLFVIEAGELPLLDRHEAYDKRGYRRTQIEVDGCGDRPQTETAWTYVVVDKSPSELSPSPDYLRLVVEGARMCGLPEPYIARLEQIATEP